MKKLTYINLWVLFTTLVFIMSCKEEVVDFSTNTCKVNPPFIKKVGFDQGHSFFSTSDKVRMGLLLEEIRNTAEPPRIYQHPSWKKAGWLAPIQIDNLGNIFVGPAPFINILNNPTPLQNTLYKVDGTTGEMNVFLELPSADSATVQNPFGILGLTYLCESNTLYVSSVAGSLRTKESGTIFAINTLDKKIIDQIKGFDALGMGVSYIEGKRKLYFGSARTSDVYSVVLDQEGKFSGSPKKVFSLEGLGARGDDRVRKIKTDAYGNLIVSGIQFSYNLIAPTERQETIYEFTYNDESKQWGFTKTLSTVK